VKRARNLAKYVLDDSEQKVETDPANILLPIDIDEAMKHLIAEATPEEEAKMNAMDGDHRQKLAQAYYAQNRDEDPSPLEDDPPSAKPHRVRHHKRA